MLSHAPSATAQVIAQQIAAALNNPATNADAPLELALDPPELGRVRMQIAEISGAMTLMIHAERPETADLMRRHLELLTQEFAEAGLGAPSVQINQEGASQGGGANQQGTADGHSTDTTEPGNAGPPALLQRAATGGLDLRL
ncbi:MAG: flagellar hook-length control protein FliK [Gymnodinialimonas sp.]